MRFFTVSLAFAAAVAPALAAPVYVVPSGSGASFWGDVEGFGKSVLGALKREDLLALQARAADVQSGSGASWLGDLGKSFLDAFQRRQELEFYQSRAELQSGSGASWLGDLGKSFLDAFQRRDEFDFQERAFDPIIFERDISLDARDGVVYPDGSGASFWSDVEHIASSILKRQVVYCVPRVQTPYRRWFFKRRGA
ncbi:hypothetical protein B0H21DRAFT_823616 [Amylocystis lapponica]|nr:hypothetical protein B0H21DRAFT_823616 [Amylocystis lapponica]